MAGKKVFKTPTLQAVILPMATSFTTPAHEIEWGDNVSFQINVVSTTSTGTFAVQVSDDYTINLNNQVSNPGNWITLTLSGTPTLTGASDQIGIALIGLPYTAIRLAYTSTVAGDGIATIFTTTKQVGS